jgi:hypothetical protein
MLTFGTQDANPQVGIMLESCVGLRQRQAHFRGEAVSLFRAIDLHNQAMTLSDDVNTT